MYVRVKGKGKAIGP